MEPVRHAAGADPRRRLARHRAARLARGRRARLPALAQRPARPHARPGRRARARLRPAPGRQPGARRAAAPARRRPGADRGRPGRRRRPRRSRRERHQLGRRGAGAQHHDAEAVRPAGRARRRPRRGHLDARPRRPVAGRPTRPTVRASCSSRPPGCTRTSGPASARSRRPPRACDWSGRRPCRTSPAAARSPWRATSTPSPATCCCAATASTPSPPAPQSSAGMRSIALPAAQAAPSGGALSGAYTPERLLRPAAADRPRRDRQHHGRRREPAAGQRHHLQGAARQGGDRQPGPAHQPRGSGCHRRPGRQGRRDLHRAGLPVRQRLGLGPLRLRRQLRHQRGRGRHRRAPGPAEPAASRRPAPRPADLPCVRVQPDPPADERRQPRRPAARVRRRAGHHRRQGPRRLQRLHLHRRDPAGLRRGGHDRPADVLDGRQQRRHDERPALDVADPRAAGRPVLQPDP